MIYSVLVEWRFANKTKIPEQHMTTKPRNNGLHARQY